MWASGEPWVEAAGVLVLTIAGGLLGWGFSRLKAPWWLAGYFLPLIAIVLYGLGMHHPSLAAIIPFTWILSGRIKFAVIGFLAALILVTPLSRISRKPARGWILALLVLMAWRMSIWPFLAPAFNQGYLASIETQFDADGVCLQTTDYTCGPAAAVTALSRLGLDADEGEIAILAHTSSAIGTPSDMLAVTLHDRYGRQGLVAEHRVFKTLDELRDAGLVLAVVKFSFMLDHYVTVLELTDTDVIVADPLTGLERWSREEFRHRWRFVGISLRRESTWQSD